MQILALTIISLGSFWVFEKIVNLENTNVQVNKKISEEMHNKNLEVKKRAKLK